MSCGVTPQECGFFLRCSPDSRRVIDDNYNYRLTTIKTFDT
jgi:hypothetical protein